MVVLVLGLSLSYAMSSPRQNKSFDVIKADNQSYVAYKDARANGGFYAKRGVILNLSR